MNAQNTKQVILLAGVNAVAEAPNWITKLEPVMHFVLLLSQIIVAGFTIYFFWAKVRGKKHGKDRN